MNSVSPNPLLALKHAWAGAVDTSDEVRRLGAELTHLDAGTPLESLDWSRYHNAVLAQANAVMALRGLIERLRPKVDQP